MLCTQKFSMGNFFGATTHGILTHSGFRKYSRFGWPSLRFEVIAAQSEVIGKICRVTKNKRCCKSKTLRCCCCWWNRFSRGFAVVVDMEVPLMNPHIKNLEVRLRTTKKKDSSTSTPARIILGRRTLSFGSWLRLSWPKGVDKMLTHIWNLCNETAVIFSCNVPFYGRQCSVMFDLSAWEEPLRLIWQS